MKNIIFTILCICCIACTQKETLLELRPLSIRDRIVVHNTLEMKSTLYAHYRIRDTKYKDLDLIAELINDNVIIAKEEISLNKYKDGFITLDIPFNKLPAQSFLMCKIYSGNELVEEKRTLIDHENLASHKKVDISNDEKLPTEPQCLGKIKSIHHGTNGAGFVLHRGHTYVYHCGNRTYGKAIDRLNLLMARNEFESIDFLVMPLKNIGKVKIEVSDLTSNGDKIPNHDVFIGNVNFVDIQKKYTETPIRLPSLIKKNNGWIETKPGENIRLWITIQTNEKINPGVYSGKITVNSENGGKQTVSFNVEVLDVILEKVPGIQYFMLMTYEFFELANHWNNDEKNAIIGYAKKVLIDYKNHGMTNLFLHSPFARTINQRNEIVLDDVITAIDVAKEYGFHKDIIWYMGHLINTAKAGSPGSIEYYDEKNDPMILEKILKRVKDKVGPKNTHNIIVCPIDEPDDVTTTYHRKRMDVASETLKNIKNMGMRTLVTSKKNHNHADYICSNRFSSETRNKARGAGKKYIVYDNDIALKAVAPNYARYKYGYYIDKNDIDGMSTWTYQTTQNARGVPGIIDTKKREVFLTYPDPDGPNTTIIWEAIREGIDDLKILHQYRKIFEIRKKNGGIEKNDLKIDVLLEKLETHIESENYKDNFDFMRLRELMLRRLDASTNKGLKGQDG